MLRLLFRLILRLDYTLFTGRIPEETLGATGLVVPPRNPGALASAPNRVLEDATLRIRMGEAGYARAKS
jgi:glycosyltransferase involved in cell wall biosynthesis